MRRFLPLLAGTFLAAVIAGCTRGHTNDAGAYCDDLKLNQSLLEADVTSELGIAPRISLYERLRDESPLEIEEDWQAVIDLVNAAAEVDLTDQEAVVAVQDQAFSTASAAQAIVEQAVRVCGITLPAVGQLTPPAATISVPETTVATTVPAT